MTTPDRHDRLARLYDAHAPRVYAYCLRQVGAHEADDVTAETFAIAWRLLEPAGRLIEPPHGGTLLDLGSNRSVPIRPGPWGWTLDRAALEVDAARDHITICSVSTTRCRSVHRAVPEGRVKLGGASYES